MKKCSRCQSLNEDGAKFCRKCGYAFSDRPWWKEIGMMPVRDFRMKNNWAFHVLWLLCVPPLYFMFGMCCELCCIFFEYRTDDTCLVLLYIGIFILCGLLLYIEVRLISGYCFRNNIRKRRKELLDSDFIEQNPQNARYSIFVRGGRNDYRFGLFDTNKVRVVLFPEYDELSWDEDCAMLKAIKNGNRFLIDVNGNKYEM